MATIGSYPVWLGSCVAIGVGLVLMSCDEPPTDAGIEEKTGEVVTFGNGVTNFTDSDGASETAILINQLNGRKVVAYNSDNRALIIYDSMSRTVAPGASLMGWSTASLAIGSTFTRHRVPADTNHGFPILWGDPSLGQIDGTSFMFLVNLAAVQSKMPPNGLAVTDMGTVLGGACVAKSTDGGLTFNLDPADCISDANQDFYDGTAITGTALNASVYAAFVNIPNNRIDLWRAPSQTGHFTLMPNPFPGKVMCDHPRLATDGQNGFVLAPDCSGGLWLACMSGGGLCTVGTWPMQVASNYTNTGHMVNVGVSVRRGAQYDIAINKSNLLLGQWADIIYAKTGASGQATFQEEACQLFGTPHTCTPRGFIDQGAGISVFSPALGVADFKPSGGSEQVIYQAAWSQQVSGGVQTFSGVMNGPNGGTTRILGRSETGTTGICADQRGYWGDYNNHIAVDQATQATTPRFWTSFSDSTNNSGTFSCTQVNAFNSVSLNSSATWINFP